MLNFCWCYLCRVTSSFHIVFEASALIILRAYKLLRFITYCEIHQGKLLGFPYEEETRYFHANFIVAITFLSNIQRSIKLNMQ